MFDFRSPDGVQFIPEIRRNALSTVKVTRALKLITSAQHRGNSNMFSYYLAVIVIYCKIEVISVYLPKKSLDVGTEVMNFN